MVGDGEKQSRSGCPQVEDERKNKSINDSGSESLNGLECAAPVCRARRSFDNH